MEHVSSDKPRLVVNRDRVRELARLDGFYDVMDAMRPPNAPGFYDVMDAMRPPNAPGFYDAMDAMRPPNAPR